MMANKKVKFAISGPQLYMMFGIDKDESEQKVLTGALENLGWKTTSMNDMVLFFRDDEDHQSEAPMASLSAIWNLHFDVEDNEALNQIFSDVDNDDKHIKSDINEVCVNWKNGEYRRYEIDDDGGGYTKSVRSADGSELSRWHPRAVTSKRH